MAYKVKEVADMVKISVRTLHHYDQIGLLKPESVSPAGYRLYTDKDLERLQQILFFKELEFNLQEIKTILENPDFDRNRALRVHKELLMEKKKRLENIIETVDSTINSIEGGIKMSKKEMFDAFDMTEIENHQRKYEEEVKQKYGHTEAYRESKEKTSKYTKEDWARIMGRQEELHKSLAALMNREPKDPEVQKIIGEWRQFITDNFYNCPPETFKGLGMLYVTDERFTAYFEKYKEGLAQFANEAIKIYCDNLE